MTASTEYEVSPIEADTALYAVYPHRRGILPKARVFVDFLTGLFKMGGLPLAREPARTSPSGNGG